MGHPMFDPGRCSIETSVGNNHRCFLHLFHPTLGLGATKLQVDKLLWEVFGCHRFQHGTGALGLLETGHWVGWFFDILMVEEAAHFTIFEEKGKHDIYIYDLIIFDKGEREASEQEWKPLCIVCLIKMSLRKPCKKKATYVSNPSQSFQPIFDIDQYFGLPKQGVPQNELVYRIFPIEIAIFGCTVLHLQSYPWNLISRWLVPQYIPILILFLQGGAPEL